MRSRRTGVCWMILLVLSCNLAQGQGVPPRQETDADKQKRTVRDIRNLGIACSVWLMDQVDAAAAENLVNIEGYPAIAAADLERLLVPNYIGEVPKLDGWGHPYEVRLNVKDLMSKQVISIRSPGRDGKFSGSTYNLKEFNPQDYDEDVVWVDGYFLRWPKKQKGVQAVIRSLPVMYRQLLPGDSALRARSRSWL